MLAYISSQFSDHFSRFPRRDLVAIVSSLAAIVALSWWYLFSLSADMTMDMSAAMMVSPVWSIQYFISMFLMWSIMMVGMMLPSVAPTVMIYSMIARKAEKDGSPVAATSTFIAGYILVWVGFSVLATYAQCLLDEAGLLSSMMAASNNLLAGSLLLMAGIWQFSPWKEQCLEHCRSPVEFIYQYWQKGNLGTLKLGLRHGLFCLGCCWAVMLVLFVFGVMNLMWIAVLSVFVLLEKILPRGGIFSLLGGSVLISAGLLFIF